MRVFVWIPSATWRPYPDVIMSVYNQTCYEDHEIQFDSESIVSHMPVEDARNTIAQRFLRSKCDYLLFLDDDNPMMPDVLELLLSHGKDYVSAIVPIRHWDEYRLNVFQDKKHVTSIEWMEPLIEISNGGTGCVLLGYDMMKAMYKKFDWMPYRFKHQEYVCTKGGTIVEYEYQDKYIEDWDGKYYTENDWRIKIVTEKISEDLFFGKNARDLGYALYADLRARCYHYKTSTTKLLVKNENLKLRSDIW